MTKAFGYVQEGYGSKTDSKAHDEYNDTYDAQIRVQNATLLKIKEDREQDEVEHNDDHWVDEEWLASEAIDERYADECHDDVDKSSGKHGILDMLVGDVRSLEDTLRIEEDLLQKKSL